MLCVTNAIPGICSIGSTLAPRERYSQQTSRKVGEDHVRPRQIAARSLSVFCPCLCPVVQIFICLIVATLYSCFFPQRYLLFLINFYLLTLWTAPSMWFFASLWGGIAFMGSRTPAKQ